MAAWPIIGVWRAATASKGTSKGTGNCSTNRQNRQQGPARGRSKGTGYCHDKGVKGTSRCRDKGAGRSVRGRSSARQWRLGVAFVGAFVVAAGAEPQKIEKGYVDIENKVTDIHWTDAPPVIDGKAEDACWTAAAVCDEFTIVRAGGRKPTQPTEVRVCCDADNLYVFWFLYEAEMDKHVPGKPPDARDVIDEREYVLLQLDPGCTRKHWYSFEANELGAQRDGSIHLGYGFDCDWQVRGGRFAKGWTVEMAVPFVELLHLDEFRGTPQAGECYGINFSRVRHAGQEKSQWSRTFGFHFYGHYGRGFFRGRRAAPQPLQAALASDKLLFYGPGTVDLALEGNLAGVTGACTIRRDRQPADEFVLPAAPAWRLPYHLTRSGAWSLTARLTRDGKPCYVCRTRAELPPVREPVRQAAEAVAAGEKRLRRFQHPVKDGLASRLAALRNALGDAEVRLAGADALTREQWQALVAETRTLREEWGKVAFDLNLMKLYPRGSQVRPFAVGAAGADEKIYEDTRCGGSLTDPVRLSLAGNEYESFQLVVMPFWRDLAEVTVRFTDLERRRDGLPFAKSPRHTVSRENFSWFHVQYVNLPDKYFGGRGRPREPDILMPVESFDVKRGQVGVVWVDVCLPKGTPAGEYRGAAIVEAAGECVERELRVRCYGFDIPDEVHVRQNHWLSMFRRQMFHGTHVRKDGARVQNFIYRPDYFERHCRMLARYRAQPFFFDGSVIWRWTPVYVEPDGRFTFDFSELDRYIDIGKKYHANAFWSSLSCNFGGLGPFFHGEFLVRERETGKRVPIANHIGDWLEKFKVGDPNSETYWDSNPAYRQFLKQYVQHLRELDMLDKSYFEIYDEPYSSEARWLDMLRHQAWLKEFVPELRLHAYGTNPKQVIGGKSVCGLIDSWAPHLFECNDQEMLDLIYQRREKYGEEFWWYTCTSREDRDGNYTPFVRYTKPYIAQRIHPWFAWKLKVDGFLVYALAYIPKVNWADKIEDRWPNREWQSDRSNGCGILVYPGPPPDYDLIPSMRLANLRDGMEDYEYFHLLRARVEQLEAETGANGRLVKRARQALHIGPDIIADVYHWTKDTAVLNRRREELARLIVRTGQAIREAK